MEFHHIAGGWDGHEVQHDRNSPSIHHRPWFCRPGGGVLPGPAEQASAAKSKDFTCYFRDATVFRDQLIKNGELDPGERFTTTDAFGHFKLVKGKGRLYLINGFDLLTGKENLLRLTAPSGSRAIGTLTALWQALLDRKQHPPRIKKLLNLPSNTNVIDFVAVPLEVSKPKQERLIKRNAEEDTLVQFIKSLSKPVSSLRPAVAPSLRALAAASRKPEDDAIGALAYALDGFRGIMPVQWADKDTLQTLLHSALNQLNVPISPENLDLLARVAASVNQQIEQASRASPQSLQTQAERRAKDAEYLANQDYKGLQDYNFPPASPAPSFPPSATPAVGIKPNAVTRGDFNRDDKPDLAVVNRNSNSVSILLGVGDGTFLPKTDFPTGAFPQHVASADVNQDGRLDLAVPNYDDSTVSVMLGQGDGSFPTSRAFPLPSGGQSSSVALGDFNADTHLDLAVTNAAVNTNKVSVLLGNGDGTFQRRLDVSTVDPTRGFGQGPIAVALADFDRDGKLDLVTANSASSTISMILGNGDGSFKVPTAYATQSGPRSVAVGDVNGDGYTDVAVASGNTTVGSVSVLLGNGDGSFQLAINYTVGRNPNAVVLGDVNGDSKVDLMTSNYNDNTVLLLLNNGDGTFQAGPTYPTGNNPWGMVLGDLNGDTRSDLAVANFYGNSVTILLNLAQ